MRNYKYSLVIPVLNEEESLPELVKNIENALKNETFEILFIDDGSTDKSKDIIKKFISQKKNIRLIAFRRNLGKSPALTLGFQKAKGEFVVMMDADLQDDPEEIKKLKEKLDEGFDLVSGWRKERRDSLLKVINSKFFNSLMSNLFNVKVHDLNCGLKLMRNDVAKELFLYGGMHRFITIISKELGFKVAEAPIKHHPRKFGESKFKSTKILTDIPDLMTIYFLTKYTKRPLHFFMKLGVPLAFLGFGALFYLSILRLFGEPIGDRPLLIFGVLFVITGLQVMLTGLIADLVVNFNRKEISDFPISFDSEKDEQS
jgi:glycosyltransferase involved in cell wall biosynthesis